MAMNKRRDLVQATNPSKMKPCVGDLIVMDGHAGNSYGHVAIISAVSGNEIEIIQQNPGAFSPSRNTLGLIVSGCEANQQPGGCIYRIESERVLGWLHPKASKI